MPIGYPVDQPWPPRDCVAPSRWYSEWGAWYTGNPDALSSVYGGGESYAERSFERVGGSVGVLLTAGAGSADPSRFWWGRSGTVGQATTRFHVPAPADISALSADLLMSEPPSLSLPRVERAADAGGDSPQLVVDHPGQARLSEIVEESDLFTILHEAAEICSSSGGVYLRGCVDPTLSGVPLAEAVPASTAVPEWRYGRLSAVTFWRPLTGERGKVWRHLERHEVLASTPPVGVVYHALYEGTRETLGSRMPLVAHPETAGLAGLVDAQSGGALTGCSILDVAYVPNMRPHAMIEGSLLGRSDYSGAEGVYDALDETWSSWMRDLRLAKGRIIVPDSYLKSNGRGAGAEFDAEQEIFQAVKTLGKPDQGMQITAVQLLIRVQEHASTTAAQWRMAMRRAGLSADAFGEEVDGGTATAKEIGKRGERTASTRQRKINYWKPALRHLATVLLQLDAVHFHGTPPVDRVSTEWPDSAAPDPETLAKTLQLLSTAGLISRYTGVQALHPDWPDSEVLQEVERIDKEHGATPLADPGMFDVPPADVPPMPMPPPVPKTEEY